MIAKRSKKDTITHAKNDFEEQRADINQPIGTTRPYLVLEPLSTSSLLVILDSKFDVIPSFLATTYAGM